MRYGYLVIAILLSQIFGRGAEAGTTPWLTDKEMGSYTHRAMVGKSYGTSIQCRDSAKGPQIRINTANFPPGYKAMNGIDKFFRWYWVVAEDSQLNSRIAKLRRKDRPHLKWRIVHRNSYTNTAGKQMACAILYR